MDGQLQFWQRRAIQYSVWLAVCSPCLLAILLTSRIPRGSIASGHVERPPLVFAQYSVNLRQIPVQPVVHGHFDFWNQGSQVLTIDSFEPSCACLAPQLLDEKRSYQPGEQGRFYVKVRTANEPPGPKEYLVKVNYTCAGRSQSRFVSFRVTLPEQKISIEPAQLVFYQIHGQPGVQRLHIADYRGNPIQVVDVTCPDEHVTATILDREVDAQGQLRVPIVVEVPANIPPGRTNAVLTIHTDDPDFPVLQAPIILFGATDRVRMVGGSTDDSQGNISPGSVHPAIELRAEPDPSHRSTSAPDHQLPPESSR